jgi:hypothetical protein
VGRAGSLPGFRIEKTLACFHSAGKYWMVRIALKSVTRRLINCRSVVPFITQARGRNTLVDML